MTFPPKKVTNADAGDADHVGGNDWDELSDYFNDVDVGAATVNTETTFRDNKLTIGTTTISDTSNIVLGTGTGTKIGTATTQKLGFFNKAPVVQPVANADTSGATLPNLEIEVNQIKQLLRDLGLMAP